MKLKYMKKILITPVFFLLVSACSLASEAPIKKLNIDRALDSIAPRANELLKKTGVPGMAIAVVQGDKIIYEQGFGVRKVGTDLKVDPKTIFLIASMSKSLASTVVASAVGHGRVQWSDPVVKYLPNFTLSNADVGTKVTIADMFAHRSGLPEYAGDLLEDLGYTRSEIIRRLRYLPLKPFLTSYNYENFGLTAGAEAVAAAEGKPWEVLTKNELYIPLKMTSTSSRWSDYNQTTNKADIHIKSDQGDWIVSARQPDAQSPAGGVSSNVKDLAKWMMLMLNDGSYQGKQIINKKALLETRQLPANVRAVIPENPPEFYGLGTEVWHDKANRLHYSHSGAFSEGTATGYILLPSAHLGIVILTNGIPVGIPEVIGLEFFDMVKYGRVEKDRFQMISNNFSQVLAGRGELAGKKPPAKPIAALPASAYVGTYDNVYYGPVMIKASGKDMSLTMGPSRVTYPLSHWDGNTFSFFATPRNKTNLSALKFIPPNNGQPAKIQIEYFDTEGLGTFEKTK